MDLILLSGLSGSGKTVALHTLEDAGYFCVDNLPIRLLEGLLDELRHTTGLGEPDQALRPSTPTAVVIDVRSGRAALQDFPETLRRLRQQQRQVQVIYLECSEETLLRRYHHTRRRHPLARHGVPLIDAIAREREWLSPVAVHADLRIDSTDLSNHELARQLRGRVLDPQQEGLSLLFQSFGFKYGVPVDADFVFDVRCLPNPYYEPGLAAQSGLDAPVIDFLQRHPDVDAMLESLQRHLHDWIPRFATDHRSYLTVAVGCTGGRHRSVYLIERLAAWWKNQPQLTVSIRHRELSRHPVVEMD